MQHAEATLDERIPLAVLMLTQHELITASLAELRHLQRRSSHKYVRVFHVPLTSKELTASDAEPMPARLGHLELRAGTSDNDGPLDELGSAARASNSRSRWPSRALLSQERASAASCSSTRSRATMLTLSPTAASRACSHNLYSLTVSEDKVGSLRHGRPCHRGQRNGADGTQRGATRARCRGG